MLRSPELSKTGTDLRIGTASWAIPAASRPAFAPAGSVLARYASRLDAVEINSSFYRDHRRGTYERWAATVPEDFRFAVKMSRRVTHECRLVGAEAALADFLDGVAGLGGKLGPILVQTPPSLRFEPAVADPFLARLRARVEGGIAVEPRHRSWFTEEAEALLAAYRVARVAADPPPVPAATEPGGDPALAYIRLHGSPHIYHSSYGAAALEGLAARVTGSRADTLWCVFDNTALGAATENALLFASAPWQGLGARASPPVAP